VCVRVRVRVRVNVRVRVHKAHAVKGVGGCCSVLQSVAACCSVLQRVAVCCSLLQSVAVCRSLLQSVAACCSLLQSNAAVCCDNDVAHEAHNAHFSKVSSAVILHSKFGSDEIVANICRLARRDARCGKSQEISQMSTF